MLADGIDHNDIWRSVQTGKGGTLFVKQGSFQPALLTNAGITLLPEEKREKAGAVDDIIDEMIDRNLAICGDTVFVSGPGPDRLNGLALVARY